MKLSEEDANLYFKLYWGLLYYVNQQHTVFQDLQSPIFQRKDAEKVNELNEYLFKHREIIDSFIKENPLHFSKEEVSIVQSWKNAITGNFFIIAHKKEYSELLDEKREQKVYGVVGLHSTIEEVAPPFLPCYVTTTLLPFKEKIVYCGLINAQNIYFGGNMKRSFLQEYHQAKSKFGVITSLNTASEKKENAEEELLRFYLKNENNRNEFEEEITKILKERPDLYSFSQQEISRSYARTTAKKLREKGITSAWFALLHETVIASGQSQRETQEVVEKILPKERRDHVHIFYYKKE